jgi:hypothetical protein
MKANDKKGGQEGWDLSNHFDQGARSCSNVHFAYSARSSLGGKTASPRLNPLITAYSRRKVGDAFVICDAGCGTVDLISYEITQLKPSLELKELVPGKGREIQLPSKSRGLNKRFEEAIKDLVGEGQYFHLRKSRRFELAVQQFDRSVKTAFRGDADEDYFINFPLAQLMGDPNKI